MKFSHSDLLQKLRRFNREGILLLPGDRIDEKFNLPLIWSEMLASDQTRSIEVLKRYWMPLADRFPSIMNSSKKRFSA